MEKISFNGKEPKNKLFKIDKNITEALRESLEDFTKGSLNISEIKEREEISETAKKVKFVLNMRFNGGEEKVFDLIQKFYEDNKNFIKDKKYIEDFGIILDGDKKEFVAEILISYPIEYSVEDEEINSEINQARELLLKLKNFLENELRGDDQLPEKQN